MPSLAALLVLGLTVSAQAATHTVAVLPFANVTKNAEGDWLSVGIIKTHSLGFVLKKNGKRKNIANNSEVLVSCRIQ